MVPGCSWSQLDSLVPRLQQAIRQMDVRNDSGQRVTMTASGSYLVVTPRAHSRIELDQVIRLLDKYLYQAKAQGAGIVFWPPGHRIKSYKKDC